MFKSLALLALSAATLHAQKETGAKHDSAELIRLENSWTTGMVHRDRHLFEKLLGKEFIYTEDDKLMRRGEVLAAITSMSDTVTAAHNEGMEVHQFNATTAAVTGWLIVKGHSKGAYTHRYRFTDTWVKRGDTWQIVAAQDYLATK